MSYVSGSLANRINIEHSYAATMGYSVQIKQEPLLEISPEDIESITTEIDLNVTKIEDPNDDYTQLPSCCDSQSENDQPVVLHESGRNESICSATTCNSSFTESPITIKKEDHTLPCEATVYETNFNDLKYQNVKLMKKSRTAERLLKGTKRKMTRQQKSIAKLIKELSDLRNKEKDLTNLSLLKDQNDRLAMRSSIAKEELRETKRKMTLQQKSIVKLKKEVTSLRDKEKELRTELVKRTMGEKAQYKIWKMREEKLKQKHGQLKEAREHIKELRQRVLAKQQCNLEYSGHKFLKLQNEKMEIVKASEKLNDTLGVTITCLVKKTEECESHKAHAKMLAYKLKLKVDEVARKDAMLIQKHMEMEKMNKHCEYCGL